VPIGECFGAKTVDDDVADVVYSASIDYFSSKIQIQILEFRICFIGDRSVHVAML
jgi:hypothetical protein